MFENPFICSVTEEYLNEILGFRNDTYNDASMDSCQVVFEFCLVKRSVGATISKYFIISLAVFHLVKELFQITQVCQKRKFFFGKLSHGQELIIYVHVYIHQVD